MKLLWQEGNTVSEQDGIRILSDEDVRMGYVAKGGEVKVAEFNRWLESVKLEEFRAGQASMTEIPLGHDE